MIYNILKIINISYLLKSIGDNSFLITSEHYNFLKLKIQEYQVHFVNHIILLQISTLNV